MRTVHVDVTVHMTLKLDESVEVGEFLDGMDYNFSPSEDNQGTIEDTEITDYEVKDS